MLFLQILLCELPRFFLRAVTVFLNIHLLIFYLLAAVSTVKYLLCNI